MGHVNPEYSSKNTFCPVLDALSRAIFNCKISVWGETEICEKEKESNERYRNRFIINNVDTFDDDKQYQSSEIIVTNASRSLVLAKIMSAPVSSRFLWVPFPQSTPAELIPAFSAVCISTDESPTNNISDGK